MQNHDQYHFLSEEINFDQIDEDLAAFQEDEMVQQALHRGVDLKKYGRDLEKELKQAESESVSQYVENNLQVVDLHKQMQDCDAVLARMQDMLYGFQADLGGISEEIKHLQDESLSMSIRLKNRRAAEEKLHKFLENTTLLPNFADSIVGPDINEIFMEAVLKLNQKLNYLHQTDAKNGFFLDINPSETFTGRSLIPDLEKLKMRALTKGRDYFTAQFNAIRKPKTNIQIVQQSSLVKYAQLFKFINDEAVNIADDLRLMYVESMGRTLFSLFRSYCTQLLRLLQSTASKQDLVAVEEAMLKSIFTQKVNLSKQTDSFFLGDRSMVLQQVEDGPILLHVALAEATRFAPEQLWRSVLKHLCDAATNEYLFIVDFFPHSPKHSATEVFNRIYSRPVSLILEQFENFLLNCHDTIGLLLLIKCTHQQRLVMQRRRMPCLDSLFDRFSLLLWPRLKSTLAAHIKSLRTANCRKLGSVDLTPHYVARRYAELVSSLLLLQSSGSAAGDLGVGGGGEVMLQNDVQQLRVELIALLDRLATLLPNSKERKVFAINNYDQVLSVFQERQISGEEAQRFEDLLMQQRELFAEEEIKCAFPKLLSFVSQTERTGQSVDEAAAETLVREFASNWRTGVQLINDDVMCYFANFRNGMEILKQVLTQLLLYYSRFQDILKKAWSRPPAFCRDLVSTATILMEIKRYSRIF